MWNDMVDITYTAADGTVITKPIKKKTVGDLKFISALLGHAGQSSSHPCHICETPWRSNVLLEDVNFDFVPTDRSLSSYASVRNTFLKSCKH